MMLRIMGAKDLSAMCNQRPYPWSDTSWRCDGLLRTSALIDIRPLQVDSKQWIAVKGDHACTCKQDQPLHGNIRSIIMRTKAKEQLYLR